jgi:hypothetical protein
LDHLNLFRVPTWSQKIAELKESIEGECICFQDEFAAIFTFSTLKKPAKALTDFIIVSF